MQSPIQNCDRLELIDESILNNEDFKKNVVIAYFKDIYKDLVAQSDSKSKGVHKNTFLTYTNLPGVIGERFFAVCDLSKTEYIELREFIHGFFKVFYSNLETKMKLSFDIYDFDRDGLISREDVRLILSHIPIEKQLKVQSYLEGAFSQEGGNSQVFKDRIQTQEEIQALLQAVFGDKKRIGFEEYSKINEELSSEMFLSIITLLQTNIPCSENYYKYKSNFENNDLLNPKKNEKKNDDAVRTIASPKIMSKLSPIANLAKTQGINLNPETQKSLLKYATNKSNAQKGPQSSDSEDESDYSKFQNKKNIEKEKQMRRKELEDLQKLGKDMITVDTSAVRLPNRVSKGLTIDPVSGTAKEKCLRDVMMSPTSFLNGSASPTIKSFATTTQENAISFEGEMLRKANETKLKKYWYCLLGKELYVYKNKTDDKHKSMHSLSGIFIKDDVEEFMDSKTCVYPFSLIFPGNKIRTFYLPNKEEKKKWMDAIKQVIGYSNLFDFYTIKETLGKGKFGLVKSAIHLKSGHSVAVKVMSKKDMTVQDVELQRREIEIMKMCQHPHIIRLLDIFENQDHIYIVMEHLKGGDLFTYLEKRDFQVSEERAKQLTHQIATAIYYLHSFGVAHRDLKPENILMSSNAETADLKIVDFGLSKIIGPNESSLDPFGTLSYVAPEVLLQKPYGKEVDLWSLGVIAYLLLCKVLPFDDDEDKEIARQTIQDAPDFCFEPWGKISKAGKDFVKRLLEKNRSKRMTLEETLQHEWFASFKEILATRQERNVISNKFEAFTLTEVNSPKIQEEIDAVQNSFML